MISEIFGVILLVFLIIVMLILVGILIFPWLALLCDLYTDWVEELQLKIYEKREMEKSKEEEK